MAPRPAFRSKRMPQEEKGPATKEAASSFDKMGVQGKVADVADAFGSGDTVSVGDIFWKEHRKSSHRSTDPRADAGLKRPKVSSAEVDMPPRTVSTPAASNHIFGSHKYGKSRFYAESIWSSDSLVRGQLFGYGELWLRSRPEDYGEMRVYLGLSSSGEMSSVEEETYHIAHSLGAASSSRVITNVDHHTIGLLPNKVVAEFADACSG
ncbi:unnamed protein product [Miscanthus lutarioriparius]|uniref:Uncharacterized protein n=1 Tax=Miscanthus lutarioriparius TaxID=422564 RepID=A0A811QM18_9POAL|nr:unnamed protein product [Miscanthus lutarioriparius]